MVHCVYIYICRGVLDPGRILHGAKCTLHPRLVFSYIGSVTA